MQIARKSDFMDKLFDAHSIRTLVRVLAVVSLLFALVNLVN